jgi:sec-independent protein translocase protein TatB
MFDISWTEFLLIGVVALIVIGPKELPSVLRTLGQWTRKVRSMAADFQGQFQEAMREAEMADLKKQVDDVARDIKNYDPLKDVRADVEATGKDIQASLEKPALMTSASEVNGQDVGVAATGPVAPEAAEKSAPELPAPAASAEPGASDAVAAATGPVVPQSTDDTAATAPENHRA